MTRIEEMITQDESVWNFNNFSPPHPWKCIGKTKENLNFDIRVERVDPQEMPFLNNCHIIVINKLLNTFLFIPIFLHLGPKQIYIWEHYWKLVPNNLNDTEICHLHPKHIPYEPPTPPPPTPPPNDKLPLRKELWVKCKFTFLSVMSKGDKIWITGICM